MKITLTVLSVSIGELKRGKNKQTKTTTTTKRTHNRTIILKNERKASWHRVEHFSEHFFFAFAFALFLLPLVPSCRSVVTTTFGHIQTYYLFIWVEHTKLLGRTQRHRDRELFGPVAIFMFAQIPKYPFHFICKSSFVYAVTIRSWCRFTLSLVFGRHAMPVLSLNRRIKNIPFVP